MAIPESEIARYLVTGDSDLAGRGSGQSWAEALRSYDDELREALLAEVKRRESGRCDAVLPPGIELTQFARNKAAKESMTEVEFQDYLDDELPGLHAIALNLLLPNQSVFDGIRQNINAFDLARYWEQGSQPVEGGPDAAILALVNNPETTLQVLDVDVGLNSQAAKSIVDHRNGADRMPNTADDRKCNSVAELDALPNVGPSTLNLLCSYAEAH